MMKIWTMTLLSTTISSTFNDVLLSFIQFSPCCTHVSDVILHTGVFYERSRVFRTASFWCSHPEIKNTARELAFPHHSLRLLLVRASKNAVSELVVLNNALHLMLVRVSIFCDTDYHDLVHLFSQKRDKRESSLAIFCRLLTLLPSAIPCSRSLTLTYCCSPWLGVMNADRKVQGVVVTPIPTSSRSRVSTTPNTSTLNRQGYSITHHRMYVDAI